MNRADVALLDQVVATVASTGFDPSAWHSSLKLVSRFIPESGATLQIFENEQPELNQIITTGYDDSALESYKTYHSRISPWAADLRRVRVGKLGFAGELPSQAFLHRTEFYND